MPARRSLSSLAVLALAIVAASTALAGGRATTAAKIVNVKAGDKGFVLSAKTAPAGAVTFVVKNTGKLPHDFKITTKKTPVLKPGKTARIAVTFKKAGAFPYSSTVKADTARGFRGTFKVTAAPAAGNTAAGKAVFVANCGTCHTLAAAGTHGTIGPALDGKALSHAAVVTIVKNGKSGSAGVMPSLSGQLTETQIDDVAAFVAASSK